MSFIKKENNIEITPETLETILEKDIDKLLQQELDKYSYFAGYNVIEKLLLNIKNNIIKKHIEGALNIKDALSTLNNKVLEEFDNYYKRLHTLREIKCTYINRADITLIIMFKVLAENLANPLEFKTIESNIINYIKNTSVRDNIKQIKRVK